MLWFHTYDDNANDKNRLKIGLYKLFNLDVIVDVFFCIKLHIKCFKPPSNLRLKDNVYFNY